MTHSSPTVYVVWSVLSVALFGFLVTHLWKFDRFASLRWGRGRQAGAFKRVMTFAYLTSVPLLVTFSVGTTVVKYREGYAAIPPFGIVPMPYQLWRPENRKLITPLYIVFSVAWGLEIVSHLEELCFWLFLTTAADHTSWFRSTHFKIWAVGSSIAIVGMPLVTVFTRQDPLQCEAWTYFAGSIGSFFITLWSLRVLWVFPAFINRVKSAGGEGDVVVRLATFHNLNVIRVIFRFLFCVPFIILASDGIQPHEHPINENFLWTDLLAVTAGVGCVVSSSMTLLIFFPRSIEREAGYKPRRKSAHTTSEKSRPHPTTLSGVQQPDVFGSPPPPASRALSNNTRSPHVLEYEDEMEVDDRKYDTNRMAATGGGVWEMVNLPADNNSPTYPPTVDSNGALGISFTTSRTHLQPQGKLRPKLHPLVMNYTSPIDLMDQAAASTERYPGRHRPANPV